ncbi:hypothetical protein HHK36_027488 [Tetracentron sinense]|uniref:CCHC-type domain-containing protein n=1 Tax=Tetracentron sinense TaxID=13715 RepID=A0A834YHX9_TETSI|nr:hypothetical protein HHK36_027488 [Tetracentron sinense]
MYLIKQLMSLRYQDGTPLTDHLNTFQGIINQLAGMGIKFDDEVQGLCLLGTLPDSWETFRMSLSNSALDGVINMDLAKSSVLNEEMRRKSQGSSSQSEVLVTEKRGRSKSRGPKNKDKGRSKSNKFANVECYHCGMKGHIKKYCRKLKREYKDKGNEKKDVDEKKDDQTDKVVIRCNDDSIDLEPVPLTDSPAQVEHATQDDQQSPSDADAPLQNETLDQLPESEMLPDVPLRRSIRDRHPSTRYSTDEKPAGDTDPPIRFNLLREIDASSGHHSLLGTSEQELGDLSVNLNNFSSEELPTQVEESSRGR